MSGPKPFQNNSPATLAHQKKGEKPCYATEKHSGCPSAGRAFFTKPFRVLLEVRLQPFLVRPAHCRRDRLSEPCEAMWSLLIGLCLGTARRRDGGRAGVAGMPGHFPIDANRQPGESRDAMAQFRSEWNAQPRAQTAVVAVAVRRFRRCMSPTMPAPMASRA